MRKKRILRSTYVRKITTQIPQDIFEQVEKWNNQHPNEKIFWQECLARGARFFIIERNGIDFFEDVASELPLNLRLKYEEKVEKLQALAKQINELKGE